MLELKNLSFKIIKNETSQVSILEDVNLTIGDYELVVITGPNGSGKSTLAKLIMGIERPSSGSIIFNGEDITTLDVTERAKREIGYAFQQPPKLRGVTVQEILSIAAGKALSTNECCRHLSDVGLCSMDYINRDVDSNLSGGELKRIEIATILARKLKLAIYDEPEAGIDLWSFSKLTESFRRLHAQKGGATIIISHQERILDLADRIIVIANGKVEAQGPKDIILPDILNQIDHACCYTTKGDMPA
jgi:Fe-S cluster assembly ATP-binding protein